MPSSLLKRFRPIEDWISVLGSASDEGRRGAHVVLGARATSVVLLVFSLIDFLAGRTLEAVQSLAVAMFFVALSARFPRGLSTTTLARSALIAGLVVISYESAIGVNEGFTFLWYYVLPLGSFFALGRREGMLWLVITAAVLAWLLFVVDPRVTPDGPLGTVALATFTLLGLLGYGLESARDRQSRRLQREKTQLQQALADLETLYDLVPICASCKSVRDDGGYWHDIEVYLEKHSAVEMEPALCPGCLREADPRVPRLEVTAPGPKTVEKTAGWSFEESEHRRRRRIYFSAGIGWMIPVVGYFGSIDLRAGRYLEAGLIFGLLALLLGISAQLWIGRRTGPRDRAAYQLAAAASLVVLAYELWVGAYGGYAVLWMYSYPALSVFVLGRRGVEWSAGAFATAAFLLLAPIGFSYPVAMSGRFLTTLGLVTLLTYSLESARERSHGQLAKESAALREALDQVQTLRGLLPICPSCKKVRDDRGFWQQIETYMARTSGAQFTHGLCPTCSERSLAELENMHELGTLS